jgi:hypothetical protein
MSFRRNSVFKRLKKEYMRGCGLDSSGSGYILISGSYKHGNEPSGSIKGDTFLDKVTDVKILYIESVSMAFVGKFET